MSKGRRFELTISVWLNEDEELPLTFTEWIGRAFAIDTSILHATPTTLERVVEARHPPAEDVVMRRQMIRTRNIYQ